MASEDPAVGSAPQVTPGPTVRFDHPDAQEYAEAASVAEDLRFAIDALTDLRARFAAAEEIKGVVASSLWRAAVVSYARCFTGGVRHAYRIDAARMPEAGDGADMFHRWLLDMRDKHVAHSVNAMEDIAPGLS